VMGWNILQIPLNNEFADRAKEKGKYLHDNIGQKKTKTFANAHQFAQPIEETKGMSLMSQKRSEKDTDFQGTRRQSWSVSLDGRSCLIASLMVINSIY
jgi:phage terminase small subunit